MVRWVFNLPPDSHTQALSAYTDSINTLLDCGSVRSPLADASRLSHACGKLSTNARACRMARETAALDERTDRWFLTILPAFPRRSRHLFPVTPVRRVDGTSAVLPMWAGMRAEPIDSRIDLGLEDNLEFMSL